MFWIEGFKDVNLLYKHKKINMHFSKICLQINLAKKYIHIIYLSYPD